MALQKKLHRYSLPPSGAGSEASMSLQPNPSSSTIGRTNLAGGAAGWAVTAWCALPQIQNHKEPYCCPACRQPIYKQEVLGRHLRGCCPDLLSAQVT